MYLLIDDIKNLAGFDIVARTSKAAKTILQFMGTEISYIGIDHDLGEEKTTGYDVLKWAFENNCIRQDVEIEIISLNPVGRDRIKNLLNDYNYVFNYSLQVYCLKELKK